MRSETTLRRSVLRYLIDTLAALLCALTCVSFAATTRTLAATRESHPESTVQSVLKGLGGSHVLIARTQFGVPHIVASTPTDLGYGFGYAFAQDDICTLADDIVTLRAERSRYFGPNGTYESVAQGQPAIDNLPSDYYYQDVNDSNVIQDQLAQPAPVGPSAEARALVDGYAAGYDAYLAKTGVDNIPDSSCRGQAWVTPITPLDIWRRILQVSDLEGRSQLISLFAAATPPAATADPTPASAARIRGDAKSLGRLTTAANIGSNGFALGRSATANRSGLVLGNPHFPWTGVDRFYEAQLDEPGELDVSGATLFGVPTIVVGHNRSVAWTHTVSAAYHLTAYTIPYVPSDPTSYVIDGRPAAMSAHRVTVEVLNPDATLSPSSHTFYSTPDGPVAAWGPGYVEAISDPNASNLRWLDTELAMGKATSVTQLRAAIARWQGLPFVNTLASDSTGEAFYGDMSEELHLTTAQLVTAGCLEGIEEGVEVVNGATSACEPGNDADAIVPGTFGPSSEPTVFRSDYVENSNDSYWLVNPNDPLSGYSPQFGPSDSPLILRTRLAMTELQQALSQPRSTISQSQLEQIDQNDLNYSAEQNRDSVVSLCRKDPAATVNGQSVDLTQACAVLAAWDLKASISSVGEAIWRQFWIDLEESPSGIPYVNPFDPSDPINTPNTLDLSNPSVLENLGQAVLDLQQAGISLTAPWGSLQGTPSSTGAEIPMPGSTGDEGVLNVVGDVFAPNPANGRYANPDFGSSYIFSTSFTPAGPQTDELLSYSESDDPSSLHYADQAPLFSIGRLARQDYTVAEIATDPHLQLTLLPVPDGVPGG
jgi:acyl-homoserine-lactone acylase